jgi:hypothetical protein
MYIQIIFCNEGQQQKIQEHLCVQEGMVAEFVSVRQFVARFCLNDKLQANYFSGTQIFGCVTYVPTCIKMAQNVHTDSEDPPSLLATWYRGFFLELIRPGLDVDHFSSCSTEVKKR